MSMSFNQFVVRDAVGVALFNAGINAFYTWWLWRSLAPLTLFDDNPIGVDLASTPVWIAMLSTLFGTAAIRGKLRDGRVTAPGSSVHRIVDMVPNGILLRSLVLGAVAGGALGLPLLMILRASAVEAISLSAAILIKVAITVPMSLVIVPLVILAGLADVQRMSARTGSRPAMVAGRSEIARRRLLPYIAPRGS